MQIYAKDCDIYGLQTLCWWNLSNRRESWSYQVCPHTGKCHPSTSIPWATKLSWQVHSKLKHHCSSSQPAVAEGQGIPVDCSVRPGLPTCQGVSHILKGVGPLQSWPAHCVRVRCESVWYRSSNLSSFPRWRGKTHRLCLQIPQPSRKELQPNWKGGTCHSIWRDKILHVPFWTEIHSPHWPQALTEDIFTSRRYASPCGLSPPALGNSAVLLPLWH